MEHMEHPPIYMVTVVPGLEHIAMQEMQGRFPTLEVVKQLRGKVFFYYTGNYKDLLLLKCIENLYLYLDSFHIGPHKADLPELSKKIKNLRIPSSITRMLHPDKVSPPKIMVSASRSGKHTFSRFDVARIVLNALVDCFPFQEGTVEQHDIAFRVDVEGDRAYIHIKLTPASFRFRGRNKEFLSGALKATVAHAMVLVSEPDETDVFLDPFCGTGTIPYERSFYDAYAILASDSSQERLEVAKRNLPDYIGMNCWDACHTELPDHSVTKIVSNLPWGKQITVDDIGSLYLNFLREAGRILAPKGKIVLLTDREDLLVKGAKKNHFRMKKITTLSLHGMHPSIFLLEK
ncbi:MAG: THUMP domain-containing protein [Clostridia bacterium]|jgi:tRNA (guanine6-N2)-methyltransferase